MRTVLQLPFLVLIVHCRHFSKEDWPKLLPRPPLYCEVGSCHDWKIAVLLTLSSKFPEADLEHIGAFFKQAWEECDKEHGIVNIGFASVKDKGSLKLYNNPEYFLKNIDRTNASRFIHETMPKVSEISDAIIHLIEDLNHTEDHHPTPPHLGLYIILITDFNFYLSEQQATSVKDILRLQHVRMKILYFEDYYEGKDSSFDSSDSNNYFELLSENQEMIEEDKAKNILKNKKMQLKLYPCQAFLNSSLASGFGEVKPEGHHVPPWIYIVSGLALLLIIVLIVFFIRGRLGKIPILDVFMRKNAFCTLKVMPNVDMNEYIHFEYKDWMIPPQNLFVDFSHKLGAGAFSYVYYGRLTGKAPICYLHHKIVDQVAYTNCEVAIKVLPQFIDGVGKSDFLQEVNLMKALVQHTHIVRMLGVCQKPEADICLVLEFCKNGDLLNFVKKHRDLYLQGYTENFKFKDLLSICWQITDGMYFLNSKDLVHRDLAARNVFLTENMTAKIGDFGLCRLTDSSIYQTRGGKMPVKWTALESLKDHEYTFKSDVWSFGVLLFEVFSFGEIPYANVPIQELLAFLESGKRLKPPKYAPDDVSEIMVRCWNEAPADRPSFKILRERLATMLSNSTEHYGYINPSSDYI
ncbi:hypothetical protein L596_015679 [Steinernema carpocapsae]|uniref:Protein kinase domain-containing protein n=1 Tax=Steinernema carpocapsae TaxID=34508 RepID=A0A4U5NFV5_STECR|nr:hypothetical protein L596_015679 [Steinernema carpocapsae]